MKIIAFLILLFQVSSCDTTTVEKPKIKLVDKPKNVFGLYSYALRVHSSHCEGVKHLIRLNQDSTFILKAYCLSGSSSDFSSRKSGRWTREKDSLYQFICTDGSTFKATVLPTEKVRVILPKSHNLEDYAFEKDTTTDKRDW